MGICKSIFASPQQPESKREVRTAVDAQNVVQPSKVEVKLVEPVENELQSKVEVKPPVEPAENEPRSSGHIRQGKRTYADIARGGRSKGRKHVMNQSSRWAKQNIASGDKAWFVLNRCRAAVVRKKYETTKKCAKSGATGFLLRTTSEPSIACAAQQR